MLEFELNLLNQRSLKSECRLAEEEENELKQPRKGKKSLSTTKDTVYFLSNELIDRNK